MTKFEESVRVRISKKGIRAEDIRVEGRLSEDEIANLDPKLVYQWIRAGDWKPKQFEQWLKVMRVIE